MNPQNQKVIEIISTDIKNDVLLQPKFDLLRFLGLVVGRSLFPLTAVFIILGTILWGPWVSLILAFGWFGVVSIWMG